MNFVLDIAMHEFGPVSIIHMEDCPGLHASANLDTYILNLHAQFRATLYSLYPPWEYVQLKYVCTADVRFMVLSNIAIFFEQVCSTKMAIKLVYLWV